MQQFLGLKVDMLALDPFDLAILTILQRENQTPLRTIGEMIHLSAAAVQRRIKRMESAGVIRANVALLNPDLVGRPLTLIVEVEVESEKVERLDEMKRRFRETPEVQQCYYVTGDADFIVIFCVAGMAEYEALTRRLFFADENVRRFRTFVAMDRVKAGMETALRSTD